MIEAFKVLWIKMSDHLIRLTTSSSSPLFTRLPNSNSIIVRSGNSCFCLSCYSLLDVMLLLQHQVYNKYVPILWYMNSLLNLSVLCLIFLHIIIIHEGSFLFVHVLMPLFSSSLSFLMGSSLSFLMHVLILFEELGCKSIYRLPGLGEDRSQTK